MLQGALAGLAAGGLYAVIAVCLTLMSRLVRVVNFSQVAIGMFGAYSAVLIAEWGLPQWAATLCGIAVGALLSGLIGWIIALWLPEADTSRRSAVSVASLLLLISLSFIVFGSKPKNFRPLLAGPAFSVGEVVITQVTVVMVILAVVVAVACRLLLTKSSIGIRLRALSERPTTAELLGVPAKSLSVAVWVATGLICTVAISIVAPTQTNDPISLSFIIVPASAAALLGGFKRLDLAVLGGLLLGVLQGALAQFEQLSILRNWVPFLIIVAFLLWTQRKEVWDVAR
ncbi:branched-chain amino acid transport system permease protein [Psychromicrobium silvestre]|uniref:Branched-chain amino acid transport system permease protein n=1 Tax=Psychromicrobium silvestre TaxID=1645614 RepID=A0A7Y9S6Q6_9MICC|nr:branched-chain amino acid ABC transporter permease [Psychromicrobium silvestre]NYE94731.1 branched-chain amino acid transport system permease protein [Psychromicrobium silvestre]